MFTFVEEPSPKVDLTMRSVFHELPRAETEGGRSFDVHKLARLASLTVVPVAAGVLLARTMTLWRRILDAGFMALGLGVLRFELARWFHPESAFDAGGKLGDLELRQYPTRIEACAQVDDSMLDRAVDHGYGRLACYICGANQTGELIERTMPFITTPHDGHYTVSFVMPSGRAIDQLPRPEHPGVELRNIPARRIAALRFRGRFTRDNIAAHEHRLLRQLAGAGFSARGSIAFAAFDSPATLPFLRRNELWVEIV